MEKLIYLKQNKPIIFYLVIVLLLVPIVLLLVSSFVLPSIRGWLFSSAKKLIEDTKQKDQILKNDIDNTQKEIDKLEEKKEDINNQLNQIKTDEDTDWHKKVKK